MKNKKKVGARERLVDHALGFCKDDLRQVRFDLLPLR